MVMVTFLGRLFQFGTTCTNLRLVPSYTAKYDAQITCTGISGAQGSWVHSEIESIGGLQRLEILFVEKRGEKLHAGMQGHLETCDPMGQVAGWVL
jgi:hypothetical protein